MVEAEAILRKILVTDTPPQVATLICVRPPSVTSRVPNSGFLPARVVRSTSRSPSQRSRSTPSDITVSVTPSIIAVHL
eukprot:CAMPEP_0181187560 /NCGR_PEP_ID=MMETSP1096-20121128/10639_1 /TAXON_ID=156174 ORGANISM="Chrysochromulina ericina, Strain CCMP281" /NCGR_SAMPLE_ID=MMETSP1096 /ASSEMBLY_ACC=CAM_ASM_000453 /LENGTH=77 /DNA_ID=CAMNT_0023276545 /DNA_START=138 /DNA_END=371 /DNA_ORIENTATION=-